MAMLTRRDLLKMGVIGAGGYLSLPHDRAFARPPSSFLDNPRSPATRPWMLELPVPDGANEVPPFFDIPDEYRRLFNIGTGLRFHEIVAEPRLVRFHPDLPETSIWTYRDKRDVSS